jgi:hypothetical protein
MSRLQKLELTDVVIESANAGGRSRKVQAEDLAHLADLKNLRVLRTAAADDESIAALARIRSVEQLDLSSSDLADAALRHLGQLDNLVSLDLGGCGEVTGSGLHHLSGLPRLRSLNLRDTAVSDEVLRDLEGFGHLEILCLDGTEIGDAGLAHLKRFTSLRRLYVGRTYVTPSGVADLQRALPDLLIFD